MEFRFTIKISNVSTWEISYYRCFSDDVHAATSLLCVLSITGRKCGLFQQMLLRLPAAHRLGKVLLWKINILYHIINLSLYPIVFDAGGCVKRLQGREFASRTWHYKHICETGIWDSLFRCISNTENMYNSRRTVYWWINYQNCKIDIFDNGICIQKSTKQFQYRCGVAFSTT